MLGYGYLVIWIFAFGLLYKWKYLPHYALFTILVILIYVRLIGRIELDPYDFFANSEKQVLRIYEVVAFHLFLHVLFSLYIRDKVKK